MKFEYELSSEDHRQCKIWFRSDDMGGLGEYPVCHGWASVFCLSFFFGLFVTRTGRTGGPILRIYRPTSYDVFPRRMCLFGGFVDMPPHLEGQIPQNINFGNVNRRSPAQLVKWQNMHITKTAASNPVKFFSVIKTTKKFSSCVV